MVLAKTQHTTNYVTFILVCLLHLFFVFALVTQHPNKPIQREQTVSIALFTIPKSNNTVEKTTPKPLPKIEKKSTLIKKIVPHIEPVKEPQVAQPKPPIPTASNNNPTESTKRLYIAPSNDSKTPPKALFNPKPPYPGEAFDKHQEGTVILDVKIAQNGKVLDVKVFKTSRFPLLDQSAMETVKLWIFDTGSITKEEWVRIPINFKIIDKLLD